MAEFDKRYREIRSALKSTARGKNIYLLDLYDAPPLDLGFQDRMHLDQYGSYQLASYIIKNETYLRFLDAVNAYYRAPQPSEQTVATSKSKPLAVIRKQ
jgi:hypothetical protein